jgi:uncharacterized protein YwbE
MRLPVSSESRPYVAIAGIVGGLALLAVGGETGSPALMVAGAGLFGLPVQLGREEEQDHPTGEIVETLGCRILTVHTGEPYGVKCALGTSGCTADHNSLEERDAVRRYRLEHMEEMRGGVVKQSEPKTRGELLNSLPDLRAHHRMLESLTPLSDEPI